MVGPLAVVARSEVTLASASGLKAAIASRSLRRWPTIETPRSFRSSAVRFGRTVSSISFSRKAASYRPRPRLRSQITMSITAAKLKVATHHRPAWIVCPGQYIAQKPEARLTVKIAHAQLADTPPGASGYIDAHPLDGQRGPTCWCGDVSAGRHDESELLAWTEHHLTPP